MEWLVQVVRLPLPSMPLSEMAPRGTELVRDQVFPDEESALLFARDLIQRGYRVRIVGPSKTMESDTVLHRLNTDTSLLSQIGKSPIARAAFIGFALAVPIEATASCYIHDADAEQHHLKVSFSPTTVSGTAGLSFGSTSVTVISGLPATYTMSADQVVLDAHLDSEYRLWPYHVAAEAPKPPPRAIIFKPKYE